jgi:pSer/pThr/pTyr-binding forkhead associated (FHA) protein
MAPQGLSRQDAAISPKIKSLSVANNNNRGDILMMQLVILKSEKAPLWLVKSCYLIGNGMSSDIRLADERLLETHLRLHVDGDKIMLEPVPGAVVSVSGARLTAGREVVHGDCIRLGRSELRILDPKRTFQSGDSDSSATTPASWVLQGLTSALSDWRYELRGVQSVGRAPNCDICLSTAHLSRQHARLTIEGRHLMVEDLGSANGTYVNGIRIDRALLNSGDELRFDTLRFRVLAPGTEEDADKTTLRPVLTGRLTTARGAKPAAAKPLASKPKVATDVVPLGVGQSEGQLERHYAVTWGLGGAIVLLGFVVAWLALS